MRYTDTHAHLYDERFSSDIDQVIQRAKESGVQRVIIPSTDSSNHRLVAKLESEYNGFAFSAYGLHPTSIVEGVDVRCELSEVERQLCSDESSPVAVGEMGLDMYWSTQYIEQQIYAFRAQVEMSLRHDLPLIIHVRDAFELLHKELKAYQGKIRGVIHGFSGTLDDYTKIRSYGGFKIGIGGVLTFKNSNLKEVIKEVDLEDILLETDCPYLSPVPYRGKRNEPSYIPVIASSIAQIKQCDIRQLSEISERNCQLLFSKIK